MDIYICVYSICILCISTSTFVFMEEEEDEVVEEEVGRMGGEEEGEEEFGRKGWRRSGVLV